MEKNGIIRIGWFLSDVCNLRCKHCYHNGNFEAQINLSNEQINLEQKIIGEIVNLSKTWDVEIIGLLGGEPLLNPYIFEYIDELNRLINTKITIATNGLLIDEQTIDKIIKYPNLYIQISLDSPDEKEHDFYRGNGTYKRTVEIIKRLVSTNINVGIRMTISTLNIHNMEKFVQFGQNENVSYVSLNKYISDLNNPTELLNALSKEQHDEFLHNILYLKKKYGEDFVVTEDPCFNLNYKDDIEAEFKEELKEQIPIAGCSAGLCNLTIGKNGEVYPCTLLPLEIGNVKKESLVNIWESENEILDSLRERKNSIKGKCAKCQSVLYCGGCRAAAFKMNGDYLMEDPFCNKEL